MRPVREAIRPSPGASWTCSRNDDERYDFVWHCHPEFELSVVTLGSGTRFVGDCVEGYEADDAVLLGSDLPHSWVSAERARAVVLQFRENFLGRDFFDLPEFARVRELLARAARGLVLPSWTVARVDALARSTPAAGTVALLALLVDLSEATDLRPLAGAGYARPPDSPGRQRVDTVIRHLHDTYDQDITVAEVAAQACMSPAALSRLFRRCTGTTLTAHLNQIRIAAACRRLGTTDDLVAAIAADCGYRSLANFNRRFREVTGTSPREYRRTRAPGLLSGRQDTAAASDVLVLARRNAPSRRIAGRQ